MDPEQAYANINNQVRLARKRMREDTGHPSYCEVENAIVQQIIDSWDDLSDWLRRGGFLPQDWQANR